MLKSTYPAVKLSLVALSFCLPLFCSAFATTAENQEGAEQATTLSRKADKEIVVPMTVDVDGAPNAYGPDNRKALDFELNAHRGVKKSGAIVGYLLDKNGKPIIQGSDDPAPGFYISTTRYINVKNNNETDPRRYVNAAEINYTVLAKSAKDKGVETGDFCVVHSIKNNKTVFAIVEIQGTAVGLKVHWRFSSGSGFQ